MTHLHVQQQALDIAKAFSTGVPVNGERIQVSSDETWDLLFILTHDTNTFPIGTPHPRFGVFDQKGVQLLSLPLTLGDTGWAAESTSAGRISWRLPGNHAGFDVISSLHKQELRWRILGTFGGQRELTIAQGKLEYTRLSATVPGGGGEVDLAGSLEMYLQFKQGHPYHYTEFTWALNGDLTEKRHYQDPTKAVALFHVSYLWDSTTGNLARKTILRISDSEQLVLRYAWNLDDTLHSITRSAI